MNTKDYRAFVRALVELQTALCNLHDAVHDHSRTDKLEPSCGPWHWDADIAIDLCLYSLPSKLSRVHLAAERIRSSKTKRDILLRKFGCVSEKLL